MSREVTNNLKNWIIEDGFSAVEEGTIRISKEIISSYNVDTEEYDIVAVPYDGAPDKWGKYGENKDANEQPSGHDWTEGNSVIIGEMYNDENELVTVFRSEYKEWGWSIADGWSENDAIGLPGLYAIAYTDKDKVFMKNNIVCDACHIYTNKFLNECDNCGSHLELIK